MHRNEIERCNSLLTFGTPILDYLGDKLVLFSTILRCNESEMHAGTIPMLNMNKMLLGLKVQHESKSGSFWQALKFEMIQPNIYLIASK